MSTYPKYRKPPSDAKTYDVGDGTKLTVREIAARLKTTQGNIRGRIGKGWTGESLLLPIATRRKEGKPRTYNAVIGYRLALKFGRRLPSSAEIREAIPMCESSSMYWRNAIREALIKENTPK